MDFDEVITDERKHSREQDLHVAAVSCLSFCMSYSGKENRKNHQGHLVTTDSFLFSVVEHWLRVQCCTKQKTAPALKGLLSGQTCDRFLTSVWAW